MCVKYLLIYLSRKNNIQVNLFFYEFYKYNVSDKYTLTSHNYKPITISASGKINALINYINTGSVG